MAMARKWDECESCTGRAQGAIFAEQRRSSHWRASPSTSFRDNFKAGSYAGSSTWVIPFLVMASSAMTFAGNPLRAEAVGKQGERAPMNRIGQWGLSVGGVLVIVADLFTSIKSAGGLATSRVRPRSSGGNPESAGTLWQSVGERRGSGERQAVHGQPEGAAYQAKERSKNIAAQLSQQNLRGPGRVRCSDRLCRKRRMQQRSSSSFPLLFPMRELLRADLPRCASRQTGEEEVFLVGILQVASTVRSGRALERAFPSRSWALCEGFMHAARGLRTTSHSVRLPRCLAAVAISLARRTDAHLG